MQKLVPRKVPINHSSDKLKKIVGENK